MKPVRRISGIAVPLPRNNIDTDAIIPQRYLVTIDKEGMAEGFFGGWRRDDDGKLDADFPLNRPEYAGARILLAGANYGCGSSREHAVWAHLAWGMQAVIAPSFGPIFYGNAAKNGLLLIVLEPAILSEVTKLVRAAGGAVEIDLYAQSISIADQTFAFSIAPQLRLALLKGTDEISETLTRVQAIAEFQARDRLLRPWIWESFSETHDGESASD